MLKYALFLLGLTFFALSKAAGKGTAGIHDDLIIGQQEVYLYGFNFQPDQFVVAGDSSGLISGHKTISIDQGPVPFGGGAGVVDSLDLNEDGIFDIAFGVTVCNTFDCFVGTSYLAGMHGVLNFVEGPISTRRFELGDTIGSIANWDMFPVYDDLHFGEFISMGIGFGGFQSSGEWLNAYEGYLGFRLVTPASDTLLGWAHVYTYSLAENGAHLEINAWAIQPDPSQKPVAALSLTPQKNAYCPGDTVQFQSATTGAEYAVWHFWDGTSDSSATATRILPDSTVTATFEAGNQYGVTLETQTLQISPLLVTAPDIILDCTHPFDTLSVETSLPADIWWIIGNDTLAGPTPPVVDSPGPVFVIAQDENGCFGSAQIEILLDGSAPLATIEYDETNHLLIAHSNSPGVAFQWSSDLAPGLTGGDSLFIIQSGVYTLIAVGQNGCTATESITVVLTATGEPMQEAFRIQPNPAGSFILLENRNPLDLNFRILDATGNFQAAGGSIKGNSVLSFQIDSLPGGLYLFAAYDTDGKPLFFKKFVKI